MFLPFPCKYLKGNGGVDWLEPVLTPTLTAPQLSDPSRKDVIQ